MYVLIFPLKYYYVEYCCFRVYRGRSMQFYSYHDGQLFNQTAHGLQALT